MNKVKTPIHVWHLEMTERPATERRHTADQPRRYTLEKIARPLPELNRFLYVTVGAPWKWYMRLDWSWQKWHDFLRRPGVETWIAYQGASPIGYFELDRGANGVTEIVYFGLIPEFVGQGLGRSFLEDAIASAWANEEKRIWLHTCTLDHPNALPNYLQRGFSIFKEEDFEDMIPSGPLEPWPGANKPNRGH